MVKHFTFFILSFFCTVVYAQRNLNNALKERISERTLPEEFTILVKGNISKLKNNTGVYNYKFNYNAGDIASITLGIEALTNLIGNKIITYAEFIEPGVQVMCDTMVVRNRITDVKNGATPLPQAYDGTNVVVGIIDSGTDWRHSDFKDALGNTRIKFLWDQNLSTNSLTPSPYNYGREYTEAMINASLCPHDDLAQYGHGTGVAGIAAGNGLALGVNEGCAPKADLVVVALNFGSPGPTISDGVNYIYSKATALGKPCVINISVGGYLGSHDGTDLQAKLIENMVQNIPGRTIVAAAGNYGQVKFHVKTQPPSGDTAFTWIRKTSGNLAYWCYADTQQIKNVQISVGANRLNFSDLGRTGFKSYDYGLSVLQNDTLKNNGNRIGIVKTSASINAYGVYELYINIIPDTMDLNWRIESKGVGLHHAWNFNFVSSGLPTVGQYPYISKYAMPDTLMTIVSGFQCLDDVITVANYINLNTYYDYNNVLQNTGETTGDRHPTSSIGPTRDGRWKPDISATGANIFTAHPVNLQAFAISNYPTLTAPGAQHVKAGGTSAASPVVAGLAALYLQANPNAMSWQVRAAINNCAYSDSFTGSGLPNAYWGYGKLDGKAAMLCAIPTLKKESENINKDVKVYPNPFTKDFTVYLNNEVEGNISIYNCEGRLIFEDRLSGSDYKLKEGSIREDESGLLFVRITSETINTSFKLLRSR